MPLNNLVDGFVRDTAERARSLVGTVVSRVSDKYDPRSGPLAALSQNPLAVSQVQYPSNLGSGPNLPYIKFNILDSVAVEGESSTDFAATVNETKKNSQIERLINSVTGVVRDATGVIATDTAEFFGIDSATQTAIKDFTSKIGLTSQFTTQRRVRKTNKVIALYMPHTMVFSQTNTYNPFSYTQGLGVIGLGAQGVESASRGDFAGAGAAVTEAVGRAALGEDALGALLYGFTGKALNPQIEVIYQETGLRNFQFEFVLAARSKAEAGTIENIINQFRSAAAPSFAGGEDAGRYLIPPSEFDIEFGVFNGAIKTLPRISTCVLTNITTDFAPSGQFSMFTDGQPMSIRMTLEFMETEIITKQRIEQGF